MSNGPASGAKTIARIFRQSEDRKGRRFYKKDLPLLRRFALRLWNEMVDQGDRGRAIYSVTLSVPDEQLARSEVLVQQLLHDLDAEDEGALFRAEPGENGRVHFHGAAITRRSELWISRRWQEISGGSPAKVKPIECGSGGWADENRVLAAGLARVIRYPSKRPPARKKRGWQYSRRLGWSPPLRHTPVRYGARGCGFVGRLWAAAAANNPSSSLPPTSRGQVGTCNECRGPALANAERSTCSGACRKIVCEARSTLRRWAHRCEVQAFLEGDHERNVGPKPRDADLHWWYRSLCPSDREWFDERAGIMEHDGALPRHLAEEKAFAELRSRVSAMLTERSERNEQTATG